MTKYRYPKHAMLLALYYKGVWAQVWSGVWIPMFKREDRPAGIYCAYRDYAAHGITGIYPLPLRKY